MKRALYLILAGVAIGILVAPDKGSETWRKLKEGLEDWKDKAIDQADELKGEGRDLVNQGKAAVGDVQRAARRTTNEWENS